MSFAIGPIEFSLEAPGATFTVGDIVELQNADLVWHEYEITEIVTQTPGDEYPYYSFRVRSLLEGVEYELPSDDATEANFPTHPEADFIGPATVNVFMDGIRLPVVVTPDPPAEPAYHSDPGLFARLLVRLFPRGDAWRMVVDKLFRRFVRGLADAPSEARDFIDATWLDTFPTTTRELARWEKQFGITAAGTDAERRLQVAAAWAAQGGQSPRYLQDVVRAAGFDVYLYEWWIPGSMPRVARNPLLYTAQPSIGTVQCMGDDLGVVQHCCTANDTPPPDPVPPGVNVWDLYPECNAWLANDVHYLVNLDLTRAAPPPIPSDTAKHRYFMYWAGSTIDTVASVPAARRDEFERLLLKLRPAQQWIVVNVDYV